ncbi:WG repeat-containing protein [Bacillus sp. H-16]|uniref:WG repeat-containing protein n=1 Tax=Alteribacter salitolerans TaxID=2912333 RepID=UPI0019659D3C|nr:WG repeat-containing protein [Alteribacter salitolerans]MBM7096144.1 WG repeat-containing protein [Alteribacter salitolerans]
MENDFYVPRLFPASVNTTEGKVWGYINSRGQFVFQPQFEEALDFQENGLAIVSDKGTGVINEDGEYVVPPVYSWILPFSDGRAVVMEEDGGSRVIDEEGNVLSDAVYPFISPYKEGRAVFQTETDDGSIVYGYLDLSGSPVIPAQYRYAFDFSEGKALVQVRDGLYALIDMEGEQLQTFPYAQMSGPGDGLLSFKETYQDKAGYVNEQGEVVIEPQFAMALPFENGRAVVNMSDDVKNLYGLIDKAGAFVIAPEYNDILLLGHDRAAVGRAIREDAPYMGSYYAIADAGSGDILTDFFYNSVSDFRHGYSSVTEGRRSFFITKKGTRAQNLPVIDGTGTLTLEGSLIKAFVDQRLSYYDRNGRIVWAQNTMIPLTDTVSIREEKYKPNKDYLVYYPQLEGMADTSAQERVNRILSQESQVKPVPPGSQLDYSYTGDFSVKFFEKDLLVLELAGYNYPFGAAHGMPTQTMVNVNVVTGEIYELSDLFLPGSDYVAVISDIIGTMIVAETDGYYFPDAYEGIRPDQPFYVTEDGLWIYFTPYEIAPYAAGFPTFNIPFPEIMELINTEGAFWRAFH